MIDLVKHQSQQLQNDYTHFEGLPEPHDQHSPDFVRGILRRWYIVLITFLLICGTAIPGGWMLIKPKYKAIAAIRVAPIIPSILFSDTDSDRVIPMYQNFMNTQADLIASDQVLQRVADSLAGKKIMLFEKHDLFSKQKKQINPTEALKQTILNGTIAIEPARRTELIKVSMESFSAEEAVLIVDAFIRAYMSIEGSKSAEGGNQKLKVLESERRAMMEKLQQQRETIRQLAEEYGTTALTGRQDMMLTRVSDILQQLTDIEATKLALQSKVLLLEKTQGDAALPDGLLERRFQFINTDPTLQALIQRIAQMEESLVLAKQTLASTNPELQRQNEILKAFQDLLEKRREELDKTFDEMMTNELAENSQGQLAKAKMQLEQAITHEEILKASLAKENKETIELGRKQLDIQDLQEQLDLNRELYGTIQRRIQVLEMEQKRPARISVAYNASSVLVPNKRVKFTIAIIFGALACGIVLAFLKDKADNNLYAPDDIIRCIGIPVLGTTSDVKQIDKTDLLEHITYDYQTIRTNLRLLNDGVMPKIIVVTSPVMAEGKTTLAINLAASLAQTGNKILLIDGDIRKPSIAHRLNISDNMFGLADVLLGVKQIDEAVHTIPLNGLDVLTTDSRKDSEVFEQLSKSETGSIINKISQNYDNVIIDTPPLLITPDALLWSKMSDAVVLSSLAGHSASPDLKETLERLARINVRVLGNVLCNVSSKHSYNRYGYDYYGKTSNKTNNNGKRTDSKSLLLSSQSKSKTTDNSNS